MQNEKPHVHMVLVGDSSVGKTAVRYRLLNNESNIIQPTVVGDAFTIDMENFVINGWDFPGHDAYRNLVSTFISRDTKIVLLVFDLSTSESFNNLNEWVETVRERTENPIIYLIGNKSDK